MGEVIFNSNTPGRREIRLKRGIYRFECWGASGGSYAIVSSSGAYVSGTISISNERTFYLFIGEKGSARNTTTTFNSGGAAYNYANPTDSNAKPSYGSSGGGATDIRLVDGTWNDLESLKSRIIVASGGGGESNYVRTNIDASLNNPARGGHGGTLIGENSTYSHCYQCSYYNYKEASGGEQENGGSKGGDDGGNDGSFGKGADATYVRNDWPSSGGGSGYFGGGSGGVSTDCLGAGAGGSSFVSGCKGCSAVTEDFTLESPKFSGNVHYSGLVFSNIVMKDGSVVNRDSKDGQIIISLQTSFFCTSKQQRHHLSLFTFIILTTK